MLQSKNTKDTQSLFNILDIPVFPYDILTDIEKNYLKKLLQGYSNIDIGAEKNLSPKTVSNHILTLKKKLGCKTNKELFTKAFSEGALYYHLDNPLFSNISDAILDDYSIYLFLVDLYLPISKLSKRELSCYQLVLNGFTLNEMGNELGISLQTVADYVSRLKHKLKCKTKRDLFFHAIENGFIEMYPFIS
jgi:DNA-binding CsgD family transcriptional regulator